MLCRLYPVILAALLISTGGRVAAETASGIGELLGMAGRSLDFGSVYDLLGVRQRLHSVTLKVTREKTLRVFQYVFYFGGGRMIPSSSYGDRVKFDPVSGSLQLLNLTAGDTGTYHITLTTEEGLDHTANVRVRLYEELSRPEIRAYQSENNISLSCVVENGTDPRQNWTKDGMSVEGCNWTRLSHDRQNLTLLARLPEVCGTYTCLVWNQLGMASANYSLRESDGFPFCREESVPLRKHLHAILIVAVLLVLLLIGVFLWVVRRKREVI